MAISLFVKGTKKMAQRAAARRGITAKCRQKSNLQDAVFCDAPCSSYSKVVRWYAEKKSVKRGRGELPGSLLFYGEKCSRSELRGGQRKKRRRRR